MKRMVISIVLILITTDAVALRVKPIRQRPKHYQQLLEDLGWDGARLAQRPFPFTWANTLMGTELQHRFELHDPDNITRVIEIGGLHRETGINYRRHMGNLEPHRVVAIFWDSFDERKKRRSVGFAVDTHINFMRHIGTNGGNILPFDIHGPALLLQAYEYSGQNIILMDKISLGKRERTDFNLSKESMVGMGYMTKVFTNIEIVLRSFYKGFTMITDPMDNNKYQEFLAGFHPSDGDTTGSVFRIDGARLSEILNNKYRSDIYA